MTTEQSYPMDTAPKDGTIIELLCADEHIIQARWGLGITSSLRIRGGTPRLRARRFHDTILQNLGGHFPHHQERRPMKEAEAKLAALKFASDMCVATRLATIEECAKVAEFSKVISTEYPDEWIRDLTPQEIAEAIRSLKSVPLDKEGKS